MKPRHFTKALAILLTVTLIVPSALLIAPQRAQAFPVTVVGDIVGWVQQTITANESVISAIKNTLIEAHTFTTKLATEAMWWNQFVLQPLAFILSGNLMKLMTAGVIQFVIGKANGTGIPQFVTDVQKSMQTVGDAKALAFFDQFGRNSNSPFAGSISSALRNDYLSKTSLAGFWAANMNTLARSTPSYAPGYLTGNWSQGGIAAWFALTTETQNNPYTFYPIAQEQLGTLIGPGVGGATGARAAELNWGQGFASWCGTTATAEQTQGQASSGYQACIAQCNTNGYSAACADSCGTNFSQSGGTMGGATSNDINPGDSCTNSDGTPGTIKTPGSVIVATLNKVLGGQQDIITRMGNVGPEITGILRDVGAVFQTVNLATQILGGPDSGGLFGVDQPSSSNSTSRLLQFQNTPTLNTTPSTIYKNAAASPVLSSNTAAGRVDQYESAWNTIRASANAASTTVKSLADFCTAAANGAETNPTMLTTASFITASREQATTALAALAPTGTIGQVLARAITAATTVATARAKAQQVQSELAAATTDAQAAQATADMVALQNMPPTDSDLANIQQEVQVFNSAQANPPGSLNVNASSLVDQMNLIATNAAALKAACTASADSYSGSSAGV